MVSSVYAVATMRGVPLEVERERCAFPRCRFAEPYADDMDFYPLRSFAASAKAMGAIDATVNLSLQLLPDNLLLGR